MRALGLRGWLGFAFRSPLGIEQGFHPALGRTFHQHLVGLEIEDDPFPFQGIFGPPQLGIARKHHLIPVLVVDGLIPGGHPVLLDHAHVAFGHDAVNLLGPQIPQGRLVRLFLGRLGGPFGRLRFGLKVDPQLVGVQGGVAVYGLHLAAEDDDPFLSDPLPGGRR